MSEIEFIYNGQPIIIQCNLEDILKDISQKFAMKNQKNLDELIFLFKGSQLNLNLKLNQIQLNDSEKIKILVYDNSYTEKLLLKFDLKDQNNNIYNINLDLSLNFDITAEYNNIFPKKIYKNIFTLEELKNKSNFFKIYNNIRDSYEDIKSLLEQNKFYIQTKNNLLIFSIKKQIGIAYDIHFDLKEEKTDINSIVYELCSKYNNLEKSNNELKLKNIILENNIYDLKLKSQNLENQINELNSKIINLEKSNNELQRYNNELKNNNKSPIIKSEGKKKEELNIKETTTEVKYPKEEFQKELHNDSRNLNQILLTKFISKLDKYCPLLKEEDIINLSKVCKNFSKPCFKKLKEINEQNLSREEKELETINKENQPLLTKFNLGKAAYKAIEALNDRYCIEYFKKEEIPDSDVLLLYRILYQLINKEKDILKVKDNAEFWKLFKEHLLKNSENGIGSYIQEQIKNFDFSEENIKTIYNLCEGKEERLTPLIIGKKDNTAKFICFLIRETLEYINISLGTFKIRKKSEVYKKYLEYIINKRKKNQQKLDKLISKE